MADHCPRAKVVVHPRGVRHLIDPSKLWQAVCQVYTQEVAERDYGGMVPIQPPELLKPRKHSRLGLLSSNSFWMRQAMPFTMFYVDEGSNAIFTGDTFGISYRELDSPQGAFTFITAPKPV